jgi:hypothetical protein
MGFDDNINTPPCGEENEENRYLLSSSGLFLSINGECAEKVNRILRRLILRRLIEYQGRI